MILQRGFLGVDFFFVLSGFLITSLLLREADRDGSFSLRNFYVRRLLRIVPVYFFVVTLLVCYFGILKGQERALELAPFYYLFLANFMPEHIHMLGITWSLAVEEQYYLLWPLVMLILPPRLLVPLAVILIAVNVAGAAGAFGVSAPRWGPLVFQLPRATYAPIIMGSLLAVVLHREWGFALAQRLLGWRWSVVAGFAALAFLLQVFPEDLEGLPDLAVHLLMTAILAGLVVREDAVLSTFLQNRVIARVGVVSYGMYLYHLIALDVAGRLFAKAGIENGWALLLCYGVLTYLIAEASFRTLEAFFRNMRPGARPVVVPASSG